MKEDTILGEKLNWVEMQFTGISLPKRDELHVWCVPLKLDQNQTEIAIERLNAHQHDRYERRTNQSQKESYLAGRYYLSELLSAYTHQDPSALELAYTRLNKPYLASNSFELDFNFTDSHGHAGNLGIYAFARNRDLGVDIEALNRRSNFAAIAKRKFTEKEQAWIKNADGSLQAQRFLSLWTRKEAYGKATGKGVNFRMNALNLVSPDQHELTFLGQETPQQRYQLKQFLIANSHIACVVHAGDIPLLINAFTTHLELVSNG